MPADQKRPARVRDPDALRRARLSADECAACGRPPGSVHHVVERGEGGDDVAGNLVVLCGDGATGCHGAWHGSPYLVGHKRRDRDWVGHRLGVLFVISRPDVIAYVRGKLDREAGDAYLARRYGIPTALLDALDTDDLGG